MLLSNRIGRIQSQLNSTAKDLTTLKSGAIGMGQRIMAMESSSSVRGTDADDIPASVRPYSEATHLLEMGVSREEVASRCGLSRAESSLLDALRKKPTA
ncbi:DUF2802 domain-containing protein [Gilvimarinus agarilyticus]|uniref:DUF2802 domain-containing protein n=1 Tax=Gilvimarinus sp. 2_MG-2023 TaxID=3062666 RepID=UPI001C084CCA|nr:DUF2802 domain-containing protein [Gilvimarinus sp. 2_MG-2023]MBU2887208.1 DUF2802 domain-containing protein [Gilvimarinus agarilyticus]MDO6571867.1 DUF2802 domain-containing protein [Gilvimarinus sp. 2_MG-2023]